MTDFARLQSGDWTPVIGAFVAGDLQYPGNWLELASPEDREALGIFEILPPDSAPAGTAPLTLAIVDHGGTPKYQHQVEVIELADAKATALAELAAARWIATQTFTYDGIETQADGAIAVLTGILTLRRELEIPVEATTAFKLGDGEFRSWDRDGLVAFGAAVSVHIQTCFGIEALATAEIMAAATAANALAIPASIAWP